MLIAVFFASPVLAQMVMHTPAEVVRVVDGDTIEVNAHYWPGHTWRGKVRLRGIDTPELRGKCEIETLMALDANAVCGDDHRAYSHLGECEQGQVCRASRSWCLVRG